MALPHHPLLALPIVAVMVVVPSAMVGLLVPTAGWAAIAMVVVSLTGLWWFARWCGSMRVFWVWSLAVLSSAILWAAGLAHLKLLWRLGPRPTATSVAGLQDASPDLPCYVQLSGILRPDFEHRATFTSTSRDHKGTRSIRTRYESTTPLVTETWRPGDPVPVLVAKAFWAETVRPVSLVGILDAPEERGGSIGAMSTGWLQVRPPRFHYDPQSVLVFHVGTTTEKFRNRLLGDLTITLILLAVTGGVDFAVTRRRKGQTTADRSRSAPAKVAAPAPAAPPQATPVQAAPAPPPATDGPDYRYGFEPIPDAGSMTDLTLERRYPPVYAAQYDYPLDLAAIGPYFDTLTALRRLRIDSDSLEELPASLARLSQLESLIVRVPLLAGRLPDLSGLRELTVLRLTAGLPAVPPSIGSLANLRSLALPDNALTDLPALIANARDLQTLDLSRNRLESLPDALAALTSLEQIDLRANRFSDLPPFLAGLPSLKEVDLRDNPIPKARHRDLRAALGKPKKLLL
jgi:hypothetical protein